ncbi:Acetyl-coenzyme A synthetase [compost metagenome]
MSNPRAEFVKARDFLILHRTEYDEAYGHFKWPKMENFNWALEYFDEIAEGNGNPALWIVDEDGKEEKYSFADLSSRSNQVANFFRKQRISHGDRIVVMLGNDSALWETMLAAMKLGAVVIPTSSLLGAEEVRDRLDRSLVKMVVTSKADLDKFETITPQIQKVVIDGPVQGWLNYADATKESAEFIPDFKANAKDPFLQYFTSGTAAKPKMVEHTYQSYPVGHLSTMYWIGLRPGDIHLNVSSPGWAKHAWSSFFAPWNAEACVFVFRQKRFSAKALLTTLQKYQVTTLCAPPTVWRMLVQENLTQYKTSLREIVSAGEPLNPEVMAKVNRAWGLSIRDGFGQTETTAMIGNSPGQKIKPGSMGRPLPGYDITLIDKENREVPEGEVALRLKNPPLGLMTGYRGDQVSSMEAMTGEFYSTGDVAYKDDDGYYTFIGRSDDVFKSSDYRISPFELESILIEHPAVAEAAVVPSPDDLRLYVPKAFIVLAAGYESTPELVREIFAFTRRRLAPFKRIRRLEFMDLPKTASGKIRRIELRLLEETKQTNKEKSEREFWENDELADTETWAQDLP